MNNASIGNLKSKYDSANLFEVIKKYPEQIKQACEIGRKSPKFTLSMLSNNFTILGMGGSAIGGSILKSYFNALDGANHLNINVVRNYNLPKFMNSDYNFIACSYSGNTEETLSSFAEARNVTKNLYCITSGGAIKDIAGKNNIPTAIIPGGYQPRCALAFSIFPLIYIFMNNGFINEAAAKNTENAFEELQALMIKRANEYSDFNSNTNKAIDIARRLHKTIPVIYSAEDRLDSINIRWRNQIQENAKNLAFGGLLPEMNHNEVNGWTITDNGLSTDIISDFTSIFLKDPDDNPRISLRYEFLQSILKNKVKDIIELTGEGTYLLTRMTDLIYLADWVSYYMALLNNTDPTPIPMISDLKELLAKK